MSRIPLAPLALALMLGAAAAHAAPPVKPAPAASVPPALAKDGWPAGELGALAREWTLAFAKGETAMRATLPRVLSAEALAKRSLEARLESYRTLHDRFGSLMLVSVDSVGTDELKVTLASADQARYRFTFTSSRERPRRLSGITLLDRRTSHSGGHFGH